MDLFSQAEHDEDAQSILLSPDAAFLDTVEASLNKLLGSLETATWCVSPWRAVAR